MGIISEDAVREFKRQIERLLMTDLGEDNDNSGISVMPECIILPVAAYSLDKEQRSRYDLVGIVSRNAILDPICIRGIHSSEFKDMDLLLEKKARDLKPDQELALNTSVAVVWTNGVLGYYDLQIYDGAPGLESPSSEVLSKFNALRTNGSFHFYAKGRAKLQDIDNHADLEWLKFKKTGAGYIRVSQLFKGPIGAVKMAQPETTGVVF
jgi:hypothetical protein